MLALLLTLGVLTSPYLESVHVPNDFVVGSGQTVGTVVMSQNVSQNTVVQLESTSATITTPASVTVIAGQKTANFTITVDPSFGPEVALVMGHTNGYSQRAKVASVTSNTDLAIAELTVRPGAGGVWVSWSGFPEDVFGNKLPGYNVLRKQGSGSFASIATGQFVDTTAVEGTAYTYRIELRDSSGGLISTSPERTVTKTGGGPSIVWPPTGSSNWSGTKTVLLGNPDQTQEHYDVYINGRH